MLPAMIGRGHDSWATTFVLDPRSVSSLSEIPATEAMMGGGSFERSKMESYEHSAKSASTDTSTHNVVLVLPSSSPDEYLFPADLLFHSAVSEPWR